MTLISRPTLAIVGAGAAGLAAAWALRDAPLAVTVFEKSRGFGGRAATRRHEGAGGTWTYDHGAQYVKTPEGHAAFGLLREALPTDDLVAIDGDVWTFDAGGRVAPGDPGHNADGKWTYRSGISQLGKLLAEASGAAVRTETLIHRLERAEAGWELHADAGAFGPFDAVLLTAPAPQSADLLHASAFDADLRALLVDGLRKATYRKIFSVVLAYDTPVPRPGDCYALVNTDGGHPVSWLAFEEEKAGHVPRGSLLIAQMAADWTRDHYFDDREVLAAAVRLLLADLLDTPLGPPAWVGSQRWRYALPDAAADADALALGTDAGLFFAGDFTAGQGRVHLALESGLTAADHIQSHLG
ncbi:MAG: FAD-dependent oxidoreductase [Rhodothermales bacterium]